MSNNDTPSASSEGLFGHTSPPNPSEAERRARLVPLDRILFGAAWIFIIAVIVLALVMSRSTHAPDVESYGFDLTGLAIERDLLMSGGMPRGGLADATGAVVRPADLPPGGMKALTEPQLLTAEEVFALNEADRGKFLVGEDRVVGVEVNGEARAYPIRVLNWHEIVNDELGGVPIAVTYSPLGDSVVVFDRRIGGEVVEFGHSGIVYNSNLVLYDVQSTAEASSLWSQLRFEAIAGPRVGERLGVLPMSVARWDAWLAAHPQTTVSRGIEAYKKQYRKNPYGHYFATGDVKYPVARSIDLAPDQPKVPLMDRMLAVPLSATADAAIGIASEAVIDGATWVTVELREVLPGTGPGPIAIDPKGEAPTFLQNARAHGGDAARSDGIPSVYCTRFAWHAMYGGLNVDQP